MRLEPPAALEGALIQYLAFLEPSHIAQVIRRREKKARLRARAALEEELQRTRRDLEQNWRSLWTLLVTLLGRLFTGR